LTCFSVNVSIKCDIKRGELRQLATTLNKTLNSRGRLFKISFLKEKPRVVKREAFSRFTIMYMQSLKTFFTLIVMSLVLAASGIAQTKTPKTVRDYFRLVPSEYFSIACCDENVDEFAKKYVSVEDNKNGYMKGEDTEEDPKYSGFVLKVFSSPNGKTYVGLYSHSINWADYYFLELRDGKLVNVSKTIPQYSMDNIYEFPQNGSTISVYRKKYDSPQKILNADYSVSKGRKLYNLVWENGKFVVKK
jgi:hypothetical protein